MSDPVEAALARLRAAPFAQSEHLVVVRRGEIVAAHALGVRGLDEPAEVFSVTKSVLATLVLLAVRDDGLSLDATLGDLLGDDVPADRRPTRIRHLLAMTGGASCGGVEDIDEVMELSTSWMQALLAVPRATPPGTAFCYDNGAVHLLAAALTRVVGDLDAYAAERLFAPLGIERWYWPRDPDGLVWGFAGLELSALSLARLGEAWRTDALGLGPLLTQATTAQTSGGGPEERPYGWLFWVDEVAGRAAFFAAGWAGQVVFVAPTAEVTVVVTGSPQRLTPGWCGPPDVARQLVTALS